MRIEDKKLHQIIRTNPTLEGIITALSGGANPTALNDQGQNAFHLALLSSNNRATIIRALLSGQNPQVLQAFISALGGHQYAPNPNDNPHSVQFINTVLHQYALSHAVDPYALILPPQPEDGYGQAIQGAGPIPHASTHQISQQWVPPEGMQIAGASTGLTTEPHPGKQSGHKKHVKKIAGGCKKTEVVREDNSPDDERDEYEHYGGVGVPFGKDFSPLLLQGSQSSPQGKSSDHGRKHSINPNETIVEESDFLAGDLIVHTELLICS